VSSRKLSVRPRIATIARNAVRGIKSGGDFGVGTESPVGIYEDGVYAVKTGGTLLLPLPPPQKCWITHTR
jgi:iron complex outermembrane recepter protein